MRTQSCLSKTAGWQFLQTGGSFIS